MLCSAHLTLTCVRRTRETKTGHVSSLAVLDEYRRHGIGRELMEILHLQVGEPVGTDLRRPLSSLKAIVQEVMALECQALICET